MRCFDRSTGLLNGFDLVTITNLYCNRSLDRFDRNDQRAVRFECQKDPFHPIQTASSNTHPLAHVQERVG